MRVFVYGTLKRGQRNYHMMRDADFLGRHRTDPCFTMFDFGGYPAVSRVGRRRIGGEVFAVDADCLRRLDDFECRYGPYRRIEIPTGYGAAWIYVVGADLCRGKPRIAGWR